MLLPILAIVSSAAERGILGGMYLFNSDFLWVYLPRVGLLGHTVTLLLTVAYALFIVAVPVFTGRRVPILHPLLSFIIGKLAVVEEAAS